MVREHTKVLINDYLFVFVGAVFVALRSAEPDLIS